LARILFVKHRNIPKKSPQSVSIRQFIVYAVLAYSAVILLFACIYFFLMYDYHGNDYWHSTLLVRGKPITDFFTLESIYFSAITMFTIGYGDITPLGWCKWVAVVEGFLGYLAPTVFVALGLSLLLNQHYEQMRRVRVQQQRLLELIASGWEPDHLLHDFLACRVTLCLCDAKGAERQVELESRCLDFGTWRQGYLSSKEEKALIKLENWLQKQG
jgi:potassium channel LctB